MKLKHVEYGVVIESEMDAAATTHSIDCDENMSRDEPIENYFHMGFKYLEIIMFLAVMHGHTLGLRQLKRILKERTLFRRKFKDDISTVADVIEQELSGSACNLGYRSGHRKLLQVHRMVTDRETVRSVLAEIPRSQRCDLSTTKTETP